VEHHHHRRLPHVHIEHRWHFVTWRLAGSLPKNRYPPPGQPDAGQAFIWMDRYLDTRRTTVLDILAKGIAEGRYQIAALVLMPNHVHLLVRPAANLSLTTKWIKGTTGKPFWQTESYDRLVRNSEEFHRIANYIETNPVKANLVQTPENYKWSTANPGVWRKLQLAKGL